MENLRFSASAILGALTEGCLAVLLPIVVLVVWMVRTKAKLVPFWVGCLVFPVFALLIEGGVAFVITFIDNKTLGILGKPLPLYLFSAAMAGIFEETGRVVGMKTLMRKYRDRRDGVTYGIGHGGIESVLLVGGGAAFTLLLALLTNTGMLDTVTAQYSDELKDAFMTNLRTMTENGFDTYMLGFFERISAIMLHVALSIIVFAGVRQKGKLWLYPLAIFIHFAADCTVIFPHVLGMPLWLFEVVFFAVAVGVLAGAVVFYRSLPQVLGEEPTAEPIQVNIQA
ncbi:MAG: YhfC family glutamic-type intramembrane protease [Ruminococcus sp.]|nr:YhfC family glutamic-type intramembrane protease [Ruminococcus sp.]